MATVLYQEMPTLIDGALFKSSIHDNGTPYIIARLSILVA